MLGSKQYAFDVKSGDVPADEWKCNLFVGNWETWGGAFVPKINGNNPWRKYYPTANQWAGFDPKPIPEWFSLPATAVRPQPGWVMSRSSGSSENPGHCGIVDYDGSMISAGQFEVHRKYDIRDHISIRATQNTMQPAAFNKYLPNQ